MSKHRDFHNKSEGLNDCVECGASAVEQIRGEMGPGDYKEQQKVNKHGRYYDDPDFYKTVELHDDNRDNHRVSCSKCLNATGWNFFDAPGAPGAIREWAIKQWNILNPQRKVTS